MFGVSTLENLDNLLPVNPHLHCPYHAQLPDFWLDFILREKRELQLHTQLAFGFPESLQLTFQPVGLSFLPL